MEYLEAWGTLIHERNLKSKILCQTPFIDDMNGSPSTSDIFFIAIALKVHRMYPRN